MSASGAHRPIKRRESRRRGNIFDITGQRDRAVNEYTQAVRTKDNTQGAQEEAAKYLKSPYERQRRSSAD